MHESSKITLIKSLFVRPDRELPSVLARDADGFLLRLPAAAA